MTIIAESAQGYFQRTAFSEIRVGDIVSIEDNQGDYPTIIEERRDTIAVTNDSVVVDGAEYNKSDYLFSVLVFPDTKTLSEPSGDSWADSLLNYGGSNLFHQVCRSVSEAEQMIVFDDMLKPSVAMDRYRHLEEIALYIPQWQDFSKVAYRIGVERIEEIISKFHKGARKKILLENAISRFYDNIQTDSNQKIFNEGGWREDVLFPVKNFLHSDVTKDNIEQLWYWVLSLAAHNSSNGAPVSIEDMVLIVDSIGQDKYLELAAIDMPLDVMKTFATQIRDNDIDTILVAHLTQPFLPGNVEWM